jgi:hypothetical protein
MISRDRFQQLAMSLEGASSAPHFDRTAFRTPRKIFATLAGDGRSANLLLDSTLQAAVVEARPAAFWPVPGGWGRMGYTTVDLTKVAEVDLVRALGEAHALANEPRPKKVRTIAGAKRPTAAKPASKKTTVRGKAKRR